MRRPEQVMADRLVHGLDATTPAHLVVELRARAIQAARDQLLDLTADGWVLLKPEDCCANAIQDLDAEVWTP